MGGRRGVRRLGVRWRWWPSDRDKPANRLRSRRDRPMNSGAGRRPRCKSWMTQADQTEPALFPQRVCCAATNVNFDNQYRLSADTNLRLTSLSEHILWPRHAQVFNKSHPRYRIRQFNNSRLWNKYVHNAEPIDKPFPHRLTRRCRSKKSVKWIDDNHDRVLLWQITLL